MLENDGVSNLVTFFRVLEIDASESAQHPDALDRLRRGDLQAVIVHRVYGLDVLPTLVERLERHDPPFLKTWFPMPFRSWFFGRNLNLAHPELSGYFSEATTFNEQLEQLLPHSLGITTYVAKILSSLDHGRPFQAPPGPDPETYYMFTTFRAHLEGGFIPPHCDNEQALRPSYRHLLSLIEPHLMSFVLLLAQPEGGGAHEVYDFRFEPLASSLMNDDHSAATPDIDKLASVSLRLPPGTLMISDSGRYLHRVSPVVGPKKRWTACSFMALSRQRDAVYCWG